MNRIARADLFIVLDDVAYRRQYYQNRTKVLDSLSRKHWLTMPVSRAPLGTAISEMKLDLGSRMLASNQSRIRTIYRASRHLGKLDSILRALGQPPPRLMDLNLGLLREVLILLDLPVPTIVPISKLVSRKERSERVLSALLAVGASRVIVGMGGMRDAHDLERWQREGIRLEIQVPPDASEYRPGGSRDGVSVIHEILNNGPVDTGASVLGYWEPRSTQGEHMNDALMRGDYPREPSA